MVWVPSTLVNKSCQKTTKFAERQPNLNSNIIVSSRSRSLGQKLWYDVEGLVTRNTHVKYVSPISHSSQVMTKVVLESRSNFKVKFLKSRTKVKVTRSKMME